MANGHDILTDIRSLLLLMSDLTDVVGSRIRREGPEAADENDPVVILELPDGEQINTLADGGFCFADLVVRCRSTDIVEADAMAETVRTNNTDPSTGLDCFRGTAGNAAVIQCERTQFGTTELQDDDGDDSGVFESWAVYSIHYEV